MVVYVLGQWRGDCVRVPAAGETPADDGYVHEVMWAIEGVFDDHAEATREAIRRGSDRFIGPMSLNAPLPADFTRPWPGAYYPASESGPSAD